MAIKLGSRVKDSITGLTGIATSRHEYLFDSPQIGVVPRYAANGKAAEVHHLSEERLFIVDTYGDPIVKRRKSTKRRPAKRKAAKRKAVKRKASKRPARKS